MHNVSCLYFLDLDYKWRIGPLNTQQKPLQINKKKIGENRIGVKIV